MKTFAVSLFLFFPVLLFSREKAVPTPSPAVHRLSAPATYAVVIGISDYQSPDIPDLRFAHRDAEAFARFLRSPAGGSLDGDHLKLLTNEQATTGEMVSSLDWLVESCKEGDQAIIYFSGHGDVEQKTAFQLGFLLSWDSPPKAYAAGAFHIYYLQAIVSTLSTENKARVLVITDACRSGKLAGNDIRGRQLTNDNLAKQYANEIKILSCQSNEYSLEGEQWGGGRGAFSYHLIDGLYGMADNNSDHIVDLKEIGRYLEDHVSVEVAPNKQMPVIVGTREEKLATVFPDILNQIREGKKGQLELFEPTESRGMEGEILAEVDTTVQKIYHRFNQYLKDKVFLEPVDACADACYERLLKEPKLERLHAAMTRNYAAALQDDAQQVLNNWLVVDSKILSLSKVKQSIKYRLYPRYLERAAELLGPAHYMYPILQARKLYFEGYLMHIDYRQADRELGEKILEKYRAALKWQPESPHVYYSMAVACFYQMQDADSAEYFARKASELAPSWIIPFSWLAGMYEDWTILHNLDKARHFLELADKVDSTAARTNIFHMYRWALYYFDSYQYAEAEQQFKRIIQLDSTFTWAHNSLGNLYLYTGRIAEAEQQYLKSIQLDSTDQKVPVNLGKLYRITHRYAEAEEQYLNSIRLDSTSLWPYIGLVAVYINTGRLDTAEILFKEIIERDSQFPLAYFEVGLVYLEENKQEKAEPLFEKAVQLDSTFADAYAYLGYIYLKTRRLADAEGQLQKAIALDSLVAWQHINLGLVYARTGRYADADQQFSIGLTLDDANAKDIAVNYAVLYSLQGKLDNAFNYLEQALEKGYQHDPWNVDILEDPALALLRAQTLRWEALMEKYIAEPEKD